MCGRFVLFENQVALNSASKCICIHSIDEYKDRAGLGGPALHSSCAKRT